MLTIWRFFGPKCVDVEPGLLELFETVIGVRCFETQYITSLGTAAASKYDRAHFSALMSATHEWRIAHACRSIQIYLHALDIYGIHLSVRTHGGTGGGLEGWRWWGRWSRLWRAFFCSRIRAVSLWYAPARPSVRRTIPVTRRLASAAETCRNSEVMRSRRYRTDGRTADWQTGRATDLAGVIDPLTARGARSSDLAVTLG